MQKLTCSNCGTTWEREPKRGRPPKLCLACKDAPKNSVSDVEPAPATLPSPKRNKRAKKSKWAKDEAPRPDLATLPFTSRTSGWCTDYDPVPEAQHEKCDGDLGKYRCPCECHGWPDL